MKITQETLKVVGKVGLRIGTNIVVEGTKAVLFKTAVAATKQGFTGGVKSIKDITLDDVLRDKKDPESKGLIKELFKRKKGQKVDVEIVEELVDEAIKEAKEMTEEV